MAAYSSRELLKRAFIDAMYEKYTEELASCTESAECSKRHKKRMKLIIDGKIVAVSHRRIDRRTVIMLIIAAILLLSGCTVYKYYDSIGVFNMLKSDENIYLDYGGSTEDDYKAEIKDTYYLRNIPHNYELVNKSGTLFYHEYMWENKVTGANIRFIQRCVSKGISAVGSEDPHFEINIGDDKIIAFEDSNDFGTYYWEMDGYIFSLWSTDLSFDDVVEVIRSIYKNSEI